MTTLLEKYGVTEAQAQSAIDRALIAKRNGYKDQVQAALTDIGKLAMPPAGHSCPDCNTHGDLYCLQIAIERLRGMRE